MFRPIFLLPQEVGWSALFYAAKNGQVEVARLLIDAGADMLLKDKVCVHVINEYF